MRVYVCVSVCVCLYVCEWWVFWCLSVYLSVSVCMSVSVLIVPLTDVLYVLLYSPRAVACLIGKAHHKCHLLLSPRLGTQGYQRFPVVGPNIALDVVPACRNSMPT